MRVFLQSLPQGMLWYPAVLVLLIVAVRIVLDVARAPRRERPRIARVPSRFEEYEDRINLRSAHATLERNCIGLVLTAEGYSGYSVNNCRHYVENGASPEIRQVIREHLEDGGVMGRRELPRRVRNRGSRAPWPTAREFSHRE